MGRSHIIVDASRDGVPGELLVYPVALSGQATSRGTHATSPEELVLLAESLYGRYAPVIIVTMAGADFSLGDGFSSIIAPKVVQVSEVVRQIYAGSQPNRCHFR